MSKLFVVQNQHGLYWGKGTHWVGGEDNQRVYRSRHRDDAINLVFELSSKDVELRAQVLECELDHRDQPVVTPADPEVVARFAPPPVESDTSADDNEKAEPSAPENRPVDA